MNVDLNDFKQEKECIYKDEQYSVRDNGAVLRHSHESKRLRKDDNQWTFGKPNEKNGYMHIGSERVHRIVAIAFHGEPPTPQHIVDHIDTNRRNNRPENLRWLTKLENALNNPITLKKIKFLCGSIEAFLKDPSILRQHTSEDQNFDWMRTVTPEEALVSWERLSNWAKKESNDTPSKGGSLGEWIFSDTRYNSNFMKEPELIKAITPNAVQSQWRTQCEFPCCPQEKTDSPIATYAKRLSSGAVFSKNNFFSSIILDFAMSKDSNTLWIMCQSSEVDPIKPWTLAQVTFENDVYVHTNLGSFFEKVGAEKRFTIAQGLEWTGGESIDDFM